jgi:hypothetical protein
MTDPTRCHDGSLRADFRLQNIRVAVHLWHSEADANAPVAMGPYMATAIPNSHIAFLSLTAKYMGEILKDLVA